MKKLKPIELSFVFFVVYLLGIYLLDYNAKLSIFMDIFFAFLFGIFVLIIFKQKKIRISPLIIVNFSFSLFCIFSILWAKDSFLAKEKSMTLLALSLLLLIIYNILVRLKIEDFEKIIKIFCIAGFILSIYTLIYYGVNSYFNGLYNNIRMGSELTNVNHIGYIASFSIAFDLFFILIRRKYLYIFLLIPTIIISLGTGSKKVVLSILITIVLIYIYQLFIKNNIKRIVQLFLVLLFAVTIFNLPAFKVIKDRTINSIASDGIGDSSTIKRKLYINAGMKTFSRHFLAGIGINNSPVANKTLTGHYVYFHNNYVELLADTGLIGFTLYYVVFIVLLFKLLQFIKEKDDISAIFAIVIMNILILDYGMVSYDLKITYIILSIVYSYIKKKKDLKKKIVVTNDNI